MNNKQLAEMVKRLRAKKLEEIIGKSGPFDPQHIKPSHKGVNTQGQEKSSPNDYLHRMGEERLEELGPTYAAGQDKQAGIASKMPADRKRYQRGNQERSPSNYTAEENKKEVELGKTDTNQSGEKISMNPKITSATGDTSKNNLTVKETKEK